MLITKKVTGDHSKKRAAIKALTWRIAASTDTALLSYLITGSLSIAATIGGFEVFTKMIFYYVHERLWAHVGGV